MGTNEKGLPAVCVGDLPQLALRNAAVRLFEGPSTCPEKNQQAVVPYFVPHQLLFINEREAPHWE